MSHTRNYAALDLGAASGRVVIGRFDGRQLQVEEMHRFSNGPARAGGSMFWDVLHLWEEMKVGLRKCAAASPKISSIGVDTWAQDFGLLGSDDVLLGNPYHYRDSRTEGMLEELFKQVTLDEVYRTTGNSLPFPIATICQLLSMVRGNSPALHAAETLLTMSGIFNFWLSARKVCDYTHVINTRCYDVRSKTWATRLMEKLGIPTHIFPQIVKSGTVLGHLVPTVADEIGLTELPVVSSGCHDTAAAVIGAPTRERDYLFLSCGTWSVLGTEIDEPHIDPNGPPEGLWNEAGARDNIRFSSNVTGLWLVQECRRLWASHAERYTYDGLTRLATRGRPLCSLVDPNDPRFIGSGDIPSRIRQFCRETSQPIPETKADVLRCILDSLALRYRVDAEAIEAALGRQMKIIHMIGGGVKNELLCQLTANATGLPVLAGPVEATATGNIVMQAIGLGHLSSVEEARELIRASIPLKYYEQDLTAADRWEEAYHRFRRLLSC